MTLLTENSNFRRNFVREIVNYTLTKCKITVRFQFVQLFLPICRLLREIYKKKKNVCGNEEEIYAKKKVFYEH